MLSQKAKYAIKALLTLARARDGDLVQANDVAERQNIPRKFLDLIFFELRRHGLVQSTRGREGGYMLALPAAVGLALVSHPLAEVMKSTALRRWTLATLLT